MLNPSITFNGVAIDQTEVKITDNVLYADVEFTYSDGSSFTEPLQFAMESGAWVFVGNGRPMYSDAWMQNYYYVNSTNTAPVMEQGFQFDFYDPKNNVTGVSIPFGATELTFGHQCTDCDDLTLTNTMSSGIPENNFVSIDATTAAAIGTDPSFNVALTLADTTTYQSTEVVDGTFNPTLTAAHFPIITSPTSTNLSDYVGQNITVTYTLPTAISFSAMFFEFEIYDNLGNDASIEGLLPLNATSITLDLTNIVANSGATTNGEMKLTALADDGSEYSYAVTFDPIGSATSPSLSNTSLTTVANAFNSMTATQGDGMVYVLSNTSDTDFQTLLGLFQTANSEGLTQSNVVSAMSDPTAASNPFTSGTTQYTAYVTIATAYESFYNSDPADAEDFGIFLTSLSATGYTSFMSVLNAAVADGFTDYASFFSSGYTQAVSDVSTATGITITPVVATSETITGIVADGYISGAVVCIDINENKVCDSGEPTATTAAGGQFAMTLESGVALFYPILVQVPAGAIDEDDPGNPIVSPYNMSAPKGKYEFVSPVTTLVQNEIETSGDSLGVLEAEARVKYNLGLDDGVAITGGGANYVANKALGDANAGTYDKIHRIAKVIARLKQKGSDSAVTGAPSSTPEEIEYAIMSEINSALDDIVGSVDEGVNTDTLVLKYGMNITTAAVEANQALMDIDMNMTEYPGAYILDKFSGRIFQDSSRRIAVKYVTTLATGQFKKYYSAASKASLSSTATLATDELVMATTDTNGAVYFNNTGEMDYRINSVKAYDISAKTLFAKDIFTYMKSLPAALMETPITFSSGAELRVLDTDTIAADAAKLESLYPSSSDYDWDFACDTALNTYCTGIDDFISYHASVSGFFARKGAKLYYFAPNSSDPTQGAVLSSLYGEVTEEGTYKVGAKSDNTPYIIIDTPSLSKWPLFGVLDNYSNTLFALEILTEDLSRDIIMLNDVAMDDVLTVLKGYQGGTPITLTDANLTSCVKSTLKLAAGDTITPLDAAGLMKLYCVDKAIADLTGLENFPMIYMLKLDDNEINDVSALASLPNLSILKMQYNGVYDISPLSGLTNLTELDLSDNVALASIAPIANRTNLVRLDIDDTAVTDLSPIAGLTNLYRIDADDLAIDNTDFSFITGLTNLFDVDIYRTNITDLAGIDALSELKVFKFRNDAGADISALANLQGIQALGIAPNAGSGTVDQSAIPFISGMSDLRELMIENVILNDMYAFAGMSQLRYFQVDPWVTATGEIEMSSLSSLGFLTYVDMNGFIYNDLYGFASIPNLKILKLSSPSIFVDQSTPRQLENADLMALSDASNLVSFIVDNTSIDTLAGIASTNPDLKVLGVSSSVIDTADLADLASFNNLVKIILTGNSITDATALNSISTLKLINLSYNPLTTISGVSSLPYLRELYLDETCLAPADQTEVNGLTLYGFGLSTSSSCI